MKLFRVGYDLSASVSEFVTIWDFSGPLSDRFMFSMHAVADLDAPFLTTPVLNVSASIGNGNESFYFDFDVHRGSSRSDVYFASRAAVNYRAYADNHW